MAILNAARDVQQVTARTTKAILSRTAMARGAALVALFAGRSIGGPKGPLSPTLQVLPWHASPCCRVLLPVDFALHASAAVVRVAPGAALRAGDALPYPAVRMEPLGALFDAVPLVEKGTLTINLDLEMDVKYSFLHVLCS